MWPHVVVNTSYLLYSTYQEQHLMAPRSWDNVDYYMYAHSSWCHEVLETFQNDCISRLVDVPQLIICASLINSIFPADSASINLTESTDLINFCWCRTNGQKCVIIIMSKILYNLSVGTNRQIIEPGFGPVSGWYLMLDKQAWLATGRGGKEETKAQREREQVSYWRHWAGCSVM